MHPNTQFHWDDRAAMRDFVASIGFATLFATTPDGPRAAHLPVVLMGDSVHVHMARGNALARHLHGLDALLVVNGPHAYISPDWYGLGPDEVPTWNYVAVEMEGRAQRLDRPALLAQMDALSAAQEQGLAPKAPWARTMADPARIDRMVDAIIGFSIPVTAWRGTTKLGQNKPQSARHAVADALDAQGRRAMAHLMRQMPDGGRPA